jgi:hypothetical protein
MFLIRWCPRDVATRQRVCEMVIKNCPNSGTQSEAVVCADPRFVVVQEEARVADGRMCARAWPTGSCILARGGAVCARVGQIDLCLGATVVQEASTSRRGNVFLSNNFIIWVTVGLSLSCNRYGYVTGSIRVGL